MAWLVCNYHQTVRPTHANIIGTIELYQNQPTNIQPLSKISNQTPFAAPASAPPTGLECLSNVKYNSNSLNKRKLYARLTSERYPYIRNAELLPAFDVYLTKVAARGIIFEKIDAKTGVVRNLCVSGAASSRYFEAGRDFIRRKLHKRLPKQSVPGVMLTLTVDPKRYTQLDGYGQIWGQFRLFRARLASWRRRNGLKQTLEYIAVVEQQKNGYVHLHVVFPGLKWLAPKGLISSWWAMGSTNIKGPRPCSPIHYACKYISKLKGWDTSSLACLWWTGARLYSMSQNFYGAVEKAAASGWAVSKIVGAVEWMSKNLADKLNICEGFIIGPDGTVMALGP